MKIIIGFILNALLICLVIPVLVLCQDEPLSKPELEDFKHSLGVSIGINDFHLKDKYLSPSIYRGKLFSSSVSYQLKLERIRHEVEARINNGRINSDELPRDVTQFVGYLSYSFAYAIDSWNLGNHELTVFLATGLSTFAAFTDFNITEKMSHNTLDDLSWYWSHAINLHLRAEYHLAERTSLALQLTMPAARLVSRPVNGHHFADKNDEVSNNFLSAAKQGKPEFLWDNFVLQCKMESRQQLSKHFDIQGTFWFGYASSDRPLPLGMYMNNLLVGLLWVF